MLIVSKSYGNHSNRLFQNINFESICYEYHIDYINPTFRDMSKLYKNPCKTLSVILPPPPIIQKILRKSGLDFYKTICCNSQENKTNNISIIIENAKNHIVFAEGWHINIPSLIMKYQQTFIDNYTLKEEYYHGNLLFKKIMDKKNEGKTVIGVHIRWGDYRYFEDGQYFYDEHVYLKYMANLAKINKNCFFIIFSNEKTSFSNDSKIVVSEEEWYIDQFLMSRCDYLIGPFSTFTLWASYMGRVKYFHIQDEEANITFDNFAMYNG